MHKAEALLAEWCAVLRSHQITDASDPMFGGFACDACETMHGRADNAVFPFLYMYTRTGDEEFLTSAKRLFHYREHFSHEDGAVQNDFGSAWKGITVFSAINIYKSLHLFGAKIPEDFRLLLEEKFRSAAEWVHENIKPGFRSNINYYAASCAVNAMYGVRYNDPAFTARAKELLSYCLGHFTEHGLLTGEGQPHNFRTEKGCAPIDIGYDAEESLPCLVDAAVILEDEDALKALEQHTLNFLEFMFPDGGWDNSFGVRNNKWTYYGSRTSDGILPVFAVLGKRNPLFYEAAARTVHILETCTRNGKLYGGPDYFDHGQAACIHHAFCHACALADALCIGLPEHTHTVSLPWDTVRAGYTYFPELDTYKIYAGDFMATVTAYDFSTYTYVRGAAHASGGTLSTLYHRKYGPIIAGSVYEYKLTEPFNMQEYKGSLRHDTLIPRGEYEKDGVFYASCLDGNAKMFICEDGGKTQVRAIAHLRNVAEKAVEDEELTLETCYTFSPEKVTLQIKPGKEKSGLRYCLPIIQNSGTVRTNCEHTTEDIFCLTGGFKATLFTFPMTESIIEIEIYGGANHG